MRTLHRGLALLALFGLCTSARAGEIEIGGEGYAFTLRDTGFRTPSLFDPGSERPSFSFSERLSLDGLGWRARAGIAFHGGEERVTFVAQRVPADNPASLQTRLGPFLQNEDVEATFTTFDARYERRVSASPRFEWRVAAGYRFARLAQSRPITIACPTCSAPDNLPATILAISSRLTAHGLRAGLASDLRLAGPLHLESEAAVALLATTKDGAGDIVAALKRIPAGTSGLPVVNLNSAIVPFVPTGKATHGRSLATWELAARLRADWKSLSASAGYRFERWSRVRALAVEPEAGFDGFTFGLGWRFGL